MVRRQPSAVAANGSNSPAGGAAAGICQGTLSLTIPAEDYKRQPNRLDVVELIGIAEGKASVLWSGPPSEREVNDAKAYLLGSLLLQFTTDAGIAGQLLYVERHHLGFDYLEKYRAAVAAVTPADVQAVARQYLDPARMVLVAAGPVDARGKPLPTLAPPKR